MISSIHLLSSGLMALCSRVDIFQIRWMFESLREVPWVCRWPMQLTVLCRENARSSQRRDLQLTAPVSHLSRRVSKTSCIERINLRHYDMFIGPCLGSLQAFALGVTECCNAETQTFLNSEICLKNAKVRL